MMRCFISIDLPMGAQEELAIVQRGIEDPDVKINTVDPKNIHLTLKFLGEITETRADSVAKVLKDLKFKKFKVKLGRIGVFPNADFIRVVWVGLSPLEEFVKLHDVIDDALGKIRFKTDKHFETHATIARVKWLKDKTKYFEKINKVEVKPIEFMVDKIHLKKSTLTEGGHVYEDLFHLDLE